MGGVKEFTVCLVVLFVVPTVVLGALPFQCYGCTGRYTDDCPLAACYVVLGALPFQCYGCTGRYTDDCIAAKDIVNCTSSQNTCMMEIINTKSALKKRYTKGCTTRNVCEQAKNRYAKGCHNAEGAICVTCCNTPRCNIRPDPTYGPDWIRLSQRSAGGYVSSGGALVMSVLSVLSMHLIFH